MTNFVVWLTSEISTFMRRQWLGLGLLSTLLLLNLVWWLAVNWAGDWAWLLLNGVGGVLVAGWYLLLRHRVKVELGSLPEQPRAKQPSQPLSKQVQLQQLELWAEEHLRQGAGPENSPPFVTGDWVVTDAVLQLWSSLQHSQQKRFHSDQMFRAQMLLDGDTGGGNRLYFDQRLEVCLSERDMFDVGYLYLAELRPVAGSDPQDMVPTEVLTGFSQLLQQLLSPYEEAIFARRSSSDFAILLPHLDTLTARALAIELVEKTVQLTERRYQFHLGLACLHQAKSVHQLLSEADMALRSAQLQGESDWFMYEAKQLNHELVKGANQWRQLIESALTQHSFVLWFQPVTLAENQLNHHHEILTRLRNDDGQLVSAAVFLPMAQQANLVVRIDQLMIEQAVNLLNYEKGSRDVCSVNLHRDSLLNNEFQHWLLEFLQRNFRIVSRIIIEISEFVLVHHGEQLVAFLDNLRKLGIRLLVDQVGLYVYNTDYIQRYQVQYLKLHSSLVKQIEQNSENQLFVESLINTCSDSPVLVFALGVENETQWQILQQLGVAGGQGHYFTEPLSLMNQLTPS